MNNLNLFKPVDDAVRESMQDSLKNILTVAACLSIMPVEGFRGDAEKMRFKWCSLKTFQAAITIALCMGNVVAITTQAARSDKGILSYGKPIKLI